MEKEKTQYIEVIAGRNIGARGCICSKYDETHYSCILWKDGMQMERKLVKKQFKIIEPKV